MDSSPFKLYDSQGVTLSDILIIPRYDSLKKKKKGMTFNYVLFDFLNNTLLTYVHFIRL